MGYSCGAQCGGPHSLVTVGLAVDFIGTAQIGQWLTVETDVIKTGSTICFAQSLVKADDVVIARANATFRVVPKKEASRSRQRFRVDGASFEAPQSRLSVSDDRGQQRISAPSAREALSSDRASSETWEIYAPPKCQSLSSITRSMKVRTLADNSRDVG